MKTISVVLIFSLLSFSCSSTSHTLTSDRESVCRSPAVDVVGCVNNLRTLKFFDFDLFREKLHVIGKDIDHLKFKWVKHSRYFIELAAFYDEKRVGHILSIPADGFYPKKEGETYFITGHIGTSEDFRKIGL